LFSALRDHRLEEGFVSKVHPCMIGFIIWFLSVSCRGQSPAEARDSSSSGMKNYSFAERVPRRYQIIGSEANRQHLTWPRFLPFMCLVLCGEFTGLASVLGEVCCLVRFQGPIT